MGPRIQRMGPYLLCSDWGQARVSKVAEREVNGLTRLAERPFHVI
jgi:hypothetical protein